MEWFQSPSIQSRRVFLNVCVVEMIILLVDWACKASGKHVNIKISEISKRRLDMSRFEYELLIIKLDDVEMFFIVFSYYYRYVEHNFATKTIPRSRT